MMRRSTLDDGETGAARRLEVHKVTIHDVAAAAGVSSGTASRVLSGHPSTSPESRKRVTEAAHRLGYRPNARARSLRKAHTDTIGLLIPDVRNPFFAEIAHNAEQAALRHALSTLLCNANECTEQQDRYLDLLYSQRVDGIVVAPQGDGSGSLREVLALEVPMVFVDRTISGIDVPSVTSDNRVGISQAVAHLAELGHRRIGLVSGPVDSRTLSADSRTTDSTARPCRTSTSMSIAVTPIRAGS